MGKPKKKLLGTVIFVIGIVLLFFALYLAISLFMDPTPLGKFVNLFPIQEGGDSLQSIILKIVAPIIGVILLWVLGNIAGRVAGLGKKVFEE